MTITTADFVELLPFSRQIEASQLAAFITQAHHLDLLPLLGHETMEAIDALPVPVLLATPPTGTPAVTGGRYVRRERVYRALSATTDPLPVLTPANSYTIGQPGTTANPPAEGAWQYERVLTLWSQYLRPYWVHRAFSRFLTTHGLNITKAGITVPIDRNQGTYDRPSAGQVATLQASVDNTTEALLSRLTRFLRHDGLLWFIDPQTGAGAYAYDGCDALPGDYPGHAAHRSRLHHSPIRGINRR